MSRRCKPGDLCVIVGLPLAIETLVGTFVTVKEPTQIADEPAWTLDREVEFKASYDCFSSTSGHMMLAGDIAYFQVIQDKFLQPIRGADLYDYVATDRVHEVTA